MIYLLTFSEGVASLALGYSCNCPGASKVILKNIRKTITKPIKARIQDDVIKWKHFRVTGHLCGEFTGHRWFPRTKASDAELFDVFFDLHPNKRLSKQSWGWWFETPSCPLWRHCNACAYFLGRPSWHHGEPPFWVFPFLQIVNSSFYEILNQDRSTAVCYWMQTS